MNFGIKQIFSYIENIEMTFKGWLLTLAGVFFIRTYLENIVSYGPTAAMGTNSQALVHLFFFWLTTTLLLMLVLHFTTKKDVVTISKISLFGLPLIFLAPVIDFLITSGAGSKMSYLFVERIQKDTSEIMLDLLTNFTTFYHGAVGITAGMKIEIILILSGLFMYMLYTKVGVFRSLLGLLGIYVIIFITMAMPNFVAYENTYSSYLLMKQSIFGQSFLYPETIFETTLEDFNVHFDGILSQVYYLMVVTLSSILLFRWNKNKVWAIIKNSRPEKVFHYFAALSFGILLAYKEGVAPGSFGYWLDWTTVVILYLSFYFAWMFAVGENDIVDKESDAINNHDRPLTSGVLSTQDLKNANLYFLAMAILGSYLAGAEAWLMCIVFISVYHIYSCPPLHLKKFAIINSGLVALATLSVIMASFFTFNGFGAVGSFPTEWVILVIVLFTLFLNIKDVKDIEGDKAVGVYTVPVIFGRKNGLLIVWGMLAAGLLIVPLALAESRFWLPSIIAIVVSWFILKREPFNERYFFYLFLPYFIYFVYVYFFSTT